MSEIVTAQIVEGLNRKYFRAGDLRRLAHVAFASRRRIEGLYSGRHETLQRGQSVEFQDYREYIAGDDLAEVDWKVFGRSDKLFVKLFEHQSDMTVRLVVDASASMAFRGCLAGAPTELSKYDQACFLAAAIAFLIAKQNDRAALAFAQGGLVQAPPVADSMARLVNLLLALERRATGAKAGLAEAVKRLMVVSGKRDLLVVLGDLWEDREPILRALSAWRQRGGEVIVFHVLHEHELELPAISGGLFIDSETGERLRLNIADIREAYAEKMSQWRIAWAENAHGRGLDYNLVSTSEPYYKTLEAYFRRRSAR
jgi:uncharacterized protein (DUF58 family)